MNPASDFPITDTVGAWVPHGRFMIEGRAQARLAPLRFAAKDLFDVAGYPTGAGNPDWLLTHEIPTRSSPVVDQLLTMGATLMGKVITDELAYSLHGDNAHYGAPRNSAAPDRVTGGSSSGSAAAVAARLVDFALGTDTGGSTRVPASYCGLWGLRTTHGLVSCEGLVPLHPSYDTVTWLAHQAQTFERVGEVLLPPSSFEARRALLLTDAAALADPEFQAPLALVCSELESMIGKPVLATTTSLSPLADWRQLYMTSGAHEGWQVHGDWIQRREPVFGAAVRARWHMACRIRDDDAARARQGAELIRRQVRELLGDDGVAVLPSAASFAPLRNADPADVDAVRMRTMAITCIAGLAGLPQVSIPWINPQQPPLGISLLGPAGSDLALIRLATALSASLASRLR